MIASKLHVSAFIMQFVSFGFQSLVKRIDSVEIGLKSLSKSLLHHVRIIQLFFNLNWLGLIKKKLLGKMHEIVWNLAGRVSH